MNTITKILLFTVAILLVMIGALCYNVSTSAFHNYLVFMVPMALLRLVHALLLIKPSKQYDRKRCI